MRRALSTCVLALLFGVAAPLTAQVSVSGGTDLVSNYVWRGFDVLDGGPALQPWVGLGLDGTGLSASVWGSAAVVNRGRLIGAVPRSDLDELDLSLGYNSTVGPLMVSAGGIHYSYFAAGYPNSATTTYEAYAGAGLASVLFAPTVTVYYDFNLGDGVYAALTGNQSIRVGRPVDVSLGIGYMDQAWRPKAGISDVNVGVGVPFAFHGAAVTPSLFFTHAPASGVLDQVNTVWARIRLSAP